MKNADQFLSNMAKRGLEIKDFSLYEQAFTHSSYRNEHKDECLDYERLEFIGDAVLDLLVGKFIFQKFPNMNSGELSKCRASLVRGKTLASFSKELGLDQFIRVSHGQEKTGEIPDKILEDVFEAFIGAFYLDNDKNFIKVEEFVKSFFIEPIENYLSYEEFDYKSRFQEFVQKDGTVKIEYVVLKESGSPQDKHFVIEVRVNGVALGKGVGSSKKKAEQMAAKEALERRVI